MIKWTVNNADIKVLLRWVDEMEEFGPDFIKNSPEWHDHELDNEWAGFRSSAFSSSGRVIYKIFKDKIIVEDIELRRTITIRNSFRGRYEKNEKCFT